MRKSFKESIKCRSFYLSAFIQTPFRKRGARITDSQGASHGRSTLGYDLGSILRSISRVGEMRLRDVFGKRYGEYYTPFPRYVLLLKNAV